MLDWFRQVARHPRTIQREKLLSIINRNRDCRYGEQFHFSDIRDADGFRSQVPVVSHKDLRSHLDEMAGGQSGVLTSEEVIFFGTTSGTTAESKFIPVTRGVLEEFQTHQLLWRAVFRQTFSRFENGGLLNLVHHSAPEKTVAGIPIGSISSILLRGKGAPGSPNVSMPRECFSIKDHSSRYFAVLRFALGAPVTVVASLDSVVLAMLGLQLARHAEELIASIQDRGWPAWIRIEEELSDRINEAIRPEPGLAARLSSLKRKYGELRPKDVWPNLEGLVCRKGASASFYLNQLRDFYGPVSILDPGYIATEGVFATPVSASGSKGVLAVASHFFEFIPRKAREANRENRFPDTLLADEVVTGEEYYVLLTASNGLYRYDINDLISVTGKFEGTPEIEFLRRGDDILTISGEKVSEGQVLLVGRRAAEECAMRLAGISAAVRVDVIPRYVFAIETRLPVDEKTAQAFIASFDRHLKEINVSYRHRRDTQGTLPRPVLLVLKPGSYDAYRAAKVARGAAPDQVKLPCIFRSEQALAQALEVDSEIA